MAYAGYACLKTRLELGGQTREAELDLRPLSDRLAE